MLHVHLPDGPTAHYKISNMVLGKDIKVGERDGGGRLLMEAGHVTLILVGNELS